MVFPYIAHRGVSGVHNALRLLEISGLTKGLEYSTQYSVTTEGGQRVQPDLVLHLPEGKSIILDSKVSLTAWVRYQACEEDDDRSAALKDHILSIAGCSSDGNTISGYTEIDPITMIRPGCNDNMFITNPIPRSINN